MQNPLLTIESLDMDARGIGHVPNEDGTPGKVIFVEGALPGETVRYSSFKKKPKWEAAQMTDLVRESSMRVKPKCEFFGICGGCAMQHLEPTAQVAMKQRVLEDNLKHIGKVAPETILRPVYGPTWGYRYRARLSVRYVEKKGGVLVGFHEKRSSFIADMKTCEILPQKISDMLVPLRELVATLSIKERMPQLELAVGQDVTALVMRNMEPLTAEDEQKLRDFADQWGIQWWLQPKGPDTVYCFYPTDKELNYTLPEFGIRMPFKPTDFTQVNHQINRVLVSRALRLLDVQPDDRVADLFCGLGNFTLPLATQAREVVGIEGSTALTTRALENAKVNGVDGKSSFFCRNLFEATTEHFVELGRFDRMLVDPPREGAMEVCKAIAGLPVEFKPKRVVYVSCNPATLARDAEVMVHVAGYRLSAAGVVNMFPHTSHVESIAVFDLA